MKDYELDPDISAVLQLLENGYSFLYKAGAKKGHWEDARCTALATLCLLHREEPNSAWITATKEFLLREQVACGETGASWNAEVWDTAMCVFALKELGLPTHHPAIDRPLHWIDSLYSLSGRSNWHDEPWETCWALIALLRSRYVPDSCNVAAALEWLTSMQDETGHLIAPHYTAYLVFSEHLSRAADLSQQQRDALRRSAAMATSCLLNALRASATTILWTGEAWSNGQILWILSMTRSFPHDDRAMLSKILTWFASEQTPEGNWSDIEDTASAILGLLGLLGGQLNGWSKMTGILLDADSEVQAVLRRIPVARLDLTRPLIQRDEVAGYVSINIRQSTLRIFRLVLGFLLVSFLAWLASVLQLLDALGRWLRSLQR